MQSHDLLQGYIELVGLHSLIESWGLVVVAQALQGFRQ